MKRILIIILLSVRFLSGANSQIFQEYYSTRVDSTMASGDIYLDLPSATWFYNNEYFNPFYKGYTLIGANVQPRIIYQNNPRLKISAGAHLHRYYGDFEKTTAKPLFTIKFDPLEKFSILMGSFSGGENHGLNEVLFSFENHLTDIVENGILIRYSNLIIKTETWLNWESFIMPGDTFQEKFTAGSMNNINLLNGLTWKLSLPVALLAHHSGGQINNNNNHIETLINISEGLKISRNFINKPLDKIYAEFTLFHSTGDFIPSSGYALSAKTGIQLTHFEVNAEYFQGNDFEGFAGNPLFRSWKANSDPAVPYKLGGTHEMLNFKAGFRHKIGNNSFLFLRMEGYYFTKSKNLDYSYSLHFQVNDLIKLHPKGKIPMN